MFSPGDMVIVLTDRGREVGTVAGRWVSPESPGEQPYVVQLQGRTWICYADDLAAAPKVRRGLR